MSNIYQFDAMGYPIFPETNDVFGDNNTLGAYGGPSASELERMIEARAEGKPKPRGLERFEQYDTNYFTGSQVSLWFGPVYVDEILMCAFQTISNLTPQYDYASSLFKMVLEGQRIIEGSFAIFFKESDYIFRVLQRVKKDQEIGNVYNYGDVVAMSKSQFQQALRGPRWKFENQVSMRPASRSVGDITEYIDERIARKNLDIEYNTDLFDLTIEYGNHRDKKFALRTFEEVKIVGTAQSIAMDDEPVIEIYKFFARERRMRDRQASKRTSTSVGGNTVTRQQALAATEEYTRRLGKTLEIYPNVETRGIERRYSDLNCVDHVGWMGLPNEGSVMFGHNVHLVELLFIVSYPSNIPMPVDTSGFVANSRVPSPIENNGVLYVESGENYPYINAISHLTDTIDYIRDGNITLGWSSQRWRTWVEEGRNIFTPGTGFPPTVLPLTGYRYLDGNAKGISASVMWQNLCGEEKTRLVRDATGGETKTLVEVSRSDPIYNVIQTRRELEVTDDNIISSSDLEYVDRISPEDSGLTNNPNGQEYVPRNWQPENTRFSRIKEGPYVAKNSDAAEDEGRVSVRHLTLNMVIIQDNVNSDDIVVTYNTNQATEGEINPETGQPIVYEEDVTMIQGRKTVHPAVPAELSGLDSSLMSDGVSDFGIWLSLRNEENQPVDIGSGVDLSSTIFSQFCMTNAFQKAAFAQSDDTITLLNTDTPRFSNTMRGITCHRAYAFPRYSSVWDSDNDGTRAVDTEEAVRLFKGYYQYAQDEGQICDQDELCPRDGIDLIRCGYMDLFSIFQFKNIGGGFLAGDVQYGQDRATGLVVPTTQLNQDNSGRFSADGELRFRLAPKKRIKTILKKLNQMADDSKITRYDGSGSVSIYNVDDTTLVKEDLGSKTLYNFPVDVFFLVETFPLTGEDFEYGIDNNGISLNPDNARYFFNRTFNVAQINIVDLDNPCMPEMRYCNIATFYDQFRTHLDLRRLVSDVVARLDDNTKELILGLAEGDDSYQEHSRDIHSYIARWLEEELLERGQTAAFSVLRNTTGTRALRYDAETDSFVPNQMSMDFVLDIQADMVTPSPWQVVADLVKDFTDETNAGLEDGYIDLLVPGES